MFRIRRLATLLTVFALAACQPERPQPGEAADTAPEPAESQEAAPAPALLDACHIRMTQPEAREWQTRWDPAHTRAAGENPSSVRSFHWADAHEQKAALDAGTAVPFELLCGSNDGVPPVIKFNIVAYDSAATDIPLAPGKYPIAPKASPAHNKPREFIVATFLLDRKMFAAQSGTLELTRFDAEGAAGSFVIDGHEILMGDRPLHLEGTFDMPCRKGLLQGACASTRAEQPQN